MGYGEFLYNVLLLCHLIAVVVGFGSAFVYPVLSTMAKGLSPKEAYAINHATFSVGRYLTTIPIVASGVFGILLVLVSRPTPIDFKQTWISIAFALFILALAVDFGLYLPNLKAMDALGAKLAGGQTKAGKQGGPPKEAKEMEERASRSAMYGGLLHAFWLLLMIDMIWKPGFGT